MTAETQPFEAEVGRVLDLVINSLYQHREIFLRELISNASDACDRLRYASLTEAGLWGDDPDLKILVVPDKARGTLTVTDNGIGMSRDELVENLGTIARSGTARFVDQLSGESSSDVNLIGQFGVGFYSAFMVAENVEVVSRKAGEDHSWRWQSDGKSGFTIDEMAVAAPRGTSVILTLRDDAKDFLDEVRVRQIVRSYSDHIPVPILFQGEAKKAEEGGGGDCPRARADQRCERALDPAQSGHHRRAIQGILPPRRPCVRRALGTGPRPGRRRAVLSGTLVHAEHAAVRPLRAAAPSWREALRQTRLHHRRSRRPDAALSALRQRRRRFRGSAAQRLTRDLAAQPRAGEDQERLGQASARRADAARQGGGRRLRDLLGDFRPRPERRNLRGSRAARAPVGTRPLPQHRA